MVRTTNRSPRISFWRFRPSAKIPATNNTAWRKFQRSSAESILPSGAPPCALYAQIVARVVPVSSTQAAEMAKLLENIFRCVNIALVNELKMLGLRMGIDIWEVIDAAATKPFGFMPFYPGPGLGGHCIPVDPYYLSWKAREYDFATRFIELAGEVNTAMPYHVVDAVAAALNERQKSLKGSRVLVLGVAYKKDVDDLRESPSLKIMELLTSAARSWTTTIRISHTFPSCATTTFEGMKSVHRRRKSWPLTTACSSPPITPATTTRRSSSAANWWSTRATPRAASRATAIRSSSAERSWPSTGATSPRSSRKAAA